ncbi:MAG: TonB-dependent receptor, partial [Arenibacter algicola]|nr:TonB-dependent receptor [Arenibacter algicola]
MKNALLVILFLPLLNLYSQTGSLTGTVMSQGEVLPWATIQLKDTQLGTTTDEAGKYLLEAPFGTYTVVCKSIGYKSLEKVITLNNSLPLQLNFQLDEDVMGLEQVVVTGTRTDKRRTDSPVIVNLINSKTLDNVVASNLSEGLRFQPGLRIETDCQTCNYTQLRINGLQGGYSQILINGRPIFSPLTGLYGMEQIPANMIERIEIVRGGVSALYGSSAIGGTVNVMTKIPRKNDYALTYTYQNMGNNSNDHLLVGNATVVNTKKNAGATFFVSKRDRDTYDDNGDNFSELPQLKNNSFGTNFFYIPQENQKLEASISSINEYRYGGEIVDKPAHMAQQSEERTHNVLMGSLDYQINFNEEKSAFILYYGGQYTDRDHYTGIIPDEEPQLSQFYSNPPYGISNVTTHQGGVQYNHRFNSFLGGKTVFTFGSEYVY